jgi:hypothetical protein
LNVISPFVISANAQKVSAPPRAKRPAARVKGE